MDMLPPAFPMHELRFDERCPRCGRIARLTELDTCFGLQRIVSCPCIPKGRVMLYDESGIKPFSVLNVEVG